MGAILKGRDTDLGRELPSRSYWTSIVASLQRFVEVAQIVVNSSGCELLRG